MDSQITNLEELLAEKSRLKSEIQLCLVSIQTDIAEIRSSFNPLKMIINFGKDMLINNHKGIVNDSLRNAIGSFSFNKLLTFMPLPYRIVSSFLLKNFVSNYLYTHQESLLEKGVYVLSMVKNFFSKGKQMA